MIVLHDNHSVEMCDALLEMVNTEMIMVRTAGLVFCLVPAAGRQATLSHLRRSEEGKLCPESASVTNE